MGHLYMDSDLSGFQNLTGLLFIVRVVFLSH